MTNAEPTPLYEPWQIVRSGNLQARPSDKRIRVLDSGACVVAQIFGPTEADRETKAKLIAGAPATAAQRDRLVKAGGEFYDAVALGPLDAAAKYGPDFDLNEHLKVKAAKFRAALDGARKS